MQSTNYTEARPLWFAEIPLTAGETISYKYVREEDCGQEWIWEERENRTLKVPECVEGSTEVLLSTDEAWVGKGGRSGGLMRGGWYVYREKFVYIFLLYFGWEVGELNAYDDILVRYCCREEQIHLRRIVDLNKSVLSFNIGYRLTRLLHTQMPR